MLTRPELRLVLQTYRGQLLVAVAWLALLVIAQITSRTPHLLAGSLMVTLCLGALRYLDQVRLAARERERDLAAEIVLAVQPPAGVPESERTRMRNLQTRIALAIRGQGAHLREGGRHG